MEQIPSIALTHISVLLVLLAPLRLRCTYQLLTPVEAFGFSQPSKRRDKSHRPNATLDTGRLCLQRKFRQLQGPVKLKVSVRKCERRFGCGSPRCVIQKNRERERERERRSAATFRFVSFMRINNHLFTVRGETAKEALSSESPLGSSSSVFLNFSPLERRSKSGAFFPPSFSAQREGPRPCARLCVCVCVLLKGVCLCMCVCACVLPSRGQTRSLSTFHNNRTKKKSGWNL